MAVELVPQKGGIGSIFHPPEGKDYKWYILPIGGVYATYHLLGEPETTIELMVNCWFGARWFGILGVHPSNNPFHFRGS